MEKWTETSQKEWKLPMNIWKIIRIVSCQWNAWVSSRPVRISHQENKWGLQRWLGHYKSSLLQRTELLVPAPTWWLVNAYESSSKGSDAIFWPLWAPTRIWNTNSHRQRHKFIKWIHLLKWKTNVGKVGGRETLICWCWECSNDGRKSVATMEIFNN